MSKYLTFSWSLKTSVTVSIWYPMTGSKCQYSPALLVPGSAFQFVLSVALSAGDRDLSKDYHHIKSYRGHSDTTDSLCLTQYKHIMSHSTCLE